MIHGSIQVSTIPHLRNSFALPKIELIFKLLVAHLALASIEKRIYLAVCDSVDNVPTPPNLVSNGSKFKTKQNKSKHKIRMGQCILNIAFRVIHMGFHVTAVTF